jgi:hypothetical protein
MSYDLAVWQGERPASDAQAGETFAKLYQQYIGEEHEDAPAPAIAAYVAALLERWPDLDDGDDDECPWADGPLINNARGPIIYFAMVWSKAEEASAYAAALAARHGLVCFDPQSEQLRP